MLRSILGATFAIMISGTSLNAQQSPGSREARCDVAIEIVRTGDSRAYSQRLTGYPESEKEKWAYSMVRVCGARGGTALAHRIRLSRTVGDTARLERYTAPTRDILDGSVFEASRSVAGDQSASTAARIYAFRTLIWTLDSSLGMFYGDLADTRTQMCARRASFHDEQTRGGSISGNRAQQILELARRVLGDANTAPALRKAAGCAHRTAARATGSR